MTNKKILLSIIRSKDETKYTRKSAKLCYKFLDQPNLFFFKNPLNLEGEDQIELHPDDQIAITIRDTKSILNISFNPDGEWTWAASGKMKC